MPDALQHAVDLLTHGLLTELPAQLMTTAIVAVATGAVRSWRRRRTASATKPTKRSDGD
jgi:hypothetical protein